MNYIYDACHSKFDRLVNKVTSAYITNTTMGVTSAKEILHLLNINTDKLNYNKLNNSIMSSTLCGWLSSTPKTLRHLLCLNSGPASFEGSSLWGLPRQVPQWDLVNQSVVVKWDSLAFGAFSWLCHQMFYPYITICAAQARDDLCHAMSPFSLFLPHFSGKQRILGSVRPGRIIAVRPPERGKRRPHLWAAFDGTCELGLPSHWDMSLSWNTAIW